MSDVSDFSTAGDCSACRFP